MSKDLHSKTIFRFTKLDQVIKFLSVCLILAFTFAQKLQAQYNVLYSFPSGSTPISSRLATDGNYFFGAVSGGGVSGNGYLYRVSIDGTGIFDLLDIDTTNIGIYNANVTLKLVGSTLYGTADQGGDYGYGLLFKINSDGNGFKKIYSFDGTNGNSPVGPVVILDTMIFGTTTFGGPYNGGIIYKISMFGNGFQMIHYFGSEDASNPAGGLLNIGTSLFGVTQHGGWYGYGNVFKLDTSGFTYYDLHEFDNTTGGSPQGGVLFADSALIGTTSSGGLYGLGNIFRLDTFGNIYKPIYDFNGGAGRNPNSDLALIGSHVFTATSQGGSVDSGAIISVSLKSNQDIRLLINLNSGLGSNPNSSLSVIGEVLYGTTASGGSGGSGVLFRNDAFLRPTSQATNINYYSIYTSQVSLNCSQGNGSNRIFFMSTDTSGTAMPKDNVSYFASSTFGEGSQIDTSGWYCVQNGPLSYDTIYGLEPNTAYRVVIFEYNGDPGFEKYLTIPAANNPKNLVTRNGPAGLVDNFSISQSYATSIKYSHIIESEITNTMLNHGICWATHSLPTLADSVHYEGADLGFFNITIGNLTPGTKYYLRSFALFPKDTAYGNIYTVTTSFIAGSLYSAYDMLIPPPYGWGKDPNNWVFGSIVGGDAYKGSNYADQPEINTLETYQLTPQSSYTTDKWTAMFEGVNRVNDAIIALGDSAGMSTLAKTTKQAELRFLHAFYYFELIKVFGPVLPWVDENNMLHNGPLPASTVWSNVEQDFTLAIANLPDIADSAGHVNIWAAKAFYGKLLLFEGQFSQAKTVFDDVMANGKTTLGTKYGLNTNFDNNFNILYNNSLESVFAQQASVDGVRNHKANPGYNIAYPYGSGPGGCCGFFQPSQSLVNSYQVDVSGLPLFDPNHSLFPYNNSDLKNDLGLMSTDSYSPDTITPVDPRLDWTVGRRGIPYLDWGIDPGANWVRDQVNGGPYVPIKNVFRFADKQAGRTGMVDGWSPGSSLNFNLMRYSDVLLMAAECEVELGNLAGAMSYVNQVRARADNSHVKNGAADAAKYQIGLYASFPDQQYAREAVRFERKLELAMEGHRFFDLARWGGYYAASEINQGFVLHESTQKPWFNIAYLDTCKLHFVIPQYVKLYLPQEKHLGDSAITLNSYTTNGLPVNYSLSDTTIAKFINGKLYFLAEGIESITAIQEMKPGCLAPSTDTKEFLVTMKSPQTIIFDSIPVKYFGEGSCSLSAYSTSGLPVSYFVKDTAVVKISGNVFYILHPGTDTIFAMQTGDPNYLAAQTVFQVVNVQKGPQKINFDYLIPVLTGDPSFDANIYSSSGLPVNVVSSDPSIADISAVTISVTGQGDVSFTATQPGDSNYTAAAPVVRVLRVLARPALSGRITGYVVDSIGNRIPEGKGYLFPLNGFTAALPTDSTQLDSTGIFYFFGLDKGLYVVQFSPALSDLQKYAPTYSGNSANWENSMQLYITQTDSSALVTIHVIELPSLKGSATISGLVEKTNKKSNGISATREYLTGRPMKGASIVLVGKSTKGAISGLGKIIARTVTNDTGYYFFSNVPLGSYLILVDIPGLPLVSYHTVDVTDKDTAVTNLNYSVGANSIFTGRSNILSNGQLLLYPNPANTSVFIMLPELAEKSILSLVDLSGRIIFEKVIGKDQNGILKLELNSLAAGPYVLILRNSEQVVRGKFIKEK